MNKENVQQDLDQVIEPTQDTQPKSEPELPEKYKGKSLSEIVRMHQEAEKLAGRHAQEVGELRKLADDYIRTNLQPKEKDVQEEEPDFFVDPKKAVRKAIESDPELKKLREKTLLLEATRNKEALEEAHPDYSEILDNEDFQKWVSESKYRKQLFQAADANWDFDAANELFSTWKGINKASARAENDTPRRSAVKQASVPSGNSSVEHVEPRKVYRRADIIRLMQTDPRRYQALQPEIMKAYQEGRVR